MERVAIPLDHLPCQPGQALEAFAEVEEEDLTITVTVTYVEGHTSRISFSPTPSVKAILLYAHTGPCSSKEAFLHGCGAAVTWLIGAVNTCDAGLVLMCDHPEHSNNIQNVINELYRTTILRLSEFSTRPLTE